jgi:hypothetical protein
MFDSFAFLKVRCEGFLYLFVSNFGMVLVIVVVIFN